METLDLIVVMTYALALIGIASIVSRERAGHVKTTQDYFFASKSLPWWAIGTSLIAANISAEQIIGMSGSGYAAGLAIASYEWMAALTLLIVGKFFIPIFLKREIYTMPQFLEQRYGASVKYTMSLFWLILYTTVNLTTVLWLGATAVNTLTGLDMFPAMVALAAFAAAYSLYGGLKAVALTDIIQVAMLVFGGALITVIALDDIGGGSGIAAGFSVLTNTLPERFDMILSPDNPEWKNLPGIAVLIGGMWMMNISYWGFNQYIIQRALSAKSLAEAQNGILFAAGLKMIMPLIIVLPGIAAVILAPDLQRPDQAYPEMMKLAPVGIRGLIFAALIAAIVSSLGSMMNSISTIFTIDLMKPLVMRDASERRLVGVGRGASLSALLIALFIAEPLLGDSPQVFQNIQNWTGYFTPGIVAVFLLGILWRRANEMGGLATIVGSVALSLTWGAVFPEMPFMWRVFAVFWLALGLGVVVSLMGKRADDAKTITLSDINFRTGPLYNSGSVIVIALLIVIYWIWW